MGVVETAVGAAAGLAAAPLLRRSACRLSACRVSLPAAAAWSTAVGGVAASSGAQDVAAAACAVWLAAFGVVSGLVDAACLRLPDVLLRPAYAGTAALVVGAGAASGASGRVLTAACGGAAALGVFALWHAGGGVGFGDVKLAGVLGLALGWSGWSSLAAGAAGAAVFGVGHGVWTRLRGRRVFAFGPALLLGALLAAAGW